jgi:hypothetical protein
LHRRLGGLPILKGSRRLANNLAIPGKGTCFLFFEVKATLRLTVNQSVSMSFVSFVTRYYFLSEGCCLKVAFLFAPSLTRGRVAVCSAITQCSESRITSNHTLLYHLRLRPSWRVRFHPPETGWPSYTPGHWV